MDVAATTNTQTTATGVAIQAGIGVAGGLNFATAQTTPSVSAQLGATDQAANTRVKVSGTVDVTALSNSSSAADMFGLQLAAGASLGFSRANAIVSPDVTAGIGKATSVEAGGNITVDAIHNRPINITLPGGSTFTAERAAIARAEAGGAAAIAGNTARAVSESRPTVHAHVLADSLIVTPAGFHVAAESNNNANALSETLTLGLASAGGVQTTATIQGNTQTSVGLNTSIDAANVEVLSTSIDRGISRGVAATGGILAGNGVTATANSIPATRANRLGTNEDVPTSSVSVTGATINSTGNVLIKSNQTVDMDAFAKGITVGAGLAAGKSESTVTVKPLLDTLVSGSTISTTGNVSILSQVGDSTNPSVRAMNIEESDASNKDEISLAFAKGSGGALVSAIGSEATTTFKPIADAHVRQSTISANDVTIISEDDSSAAAIARNFSAGVVARGRAEATLDMKDDLSTSVSGISESGSSVINAARNFTLKSESDQDGDAFSNTRAIAGFPTGRATTTIHGDFDLSADVGQFTDIQANNSVLIQSQAEQASFGSQQSTEPGDPSNIFGRPNYFGANANSDAGGLSADAFATATTLLGSGTTPAVAVTSVGAFSSITAPTVTISSDVQNVNLKSDANARSAGANVDVSSTSTGEVHSFARLNLSDNSVIDATSVNLSALNGSTSTGILSEVESTTDKDGLGSAPQANGITRMDTDSTIDARNGSKIVTRNLNVLADTNVTQFDLFVKENDTNRAGSGNRVSSFERDRSIHWNADLVLKGAASPSLIIEQDTAGNAVVTSASGVTIQDTDGITLGPVAAATITVNPVVNNAAFGNVLLNIPRRGTPADDTGVIDGNLGSVTIQRGFDEVNLVNRSSKPMTVNSINVFNLTTPQIIVDAPDSAILSFPVFQNFGDTKINIENSIKSAPAPVLTINGVINNPVGETTLNAGSIARTGGGKLVTNVADVRSTVGNIGGTLRLPIELVVSNGRQEDLRINSAGSVALDLMARQRQPVGTPATTIDASAINAAGTNNVFLRSTVMENSLPATLPLLRVNEIQENDITDVVSFFETTEEIINLDLGALGTGTATPVASTWSFGSVSGSAITMTLDTAQIDGPLMNIVGNTDVGTGSTTVSTNGDIQLTESAGPMRISAITTTRGSVTLNSADAILVSPVDTTADVVGNTVVLNAAAAIGASTAPVDVNSGNRLSAMAGSDVFLTETDGNANIGQIASTGGNVTLTVTAGSALDADADAAADVVGNSIAVTANNTTMTVAPTIGTATDALELNSSVAAPGTVRLIGRGDVNVTETAGAMSLTEARSTTGNIRVTVPDTAGTGSDLTLSSAQVIAQAGSVQLNVGDNLTSTTGTVVQGTLIGMVVDFGDADPGVGSTVNLAGSFTGRPITLASGADADNITLNQTAFQGQTNLSLDAGNDSLTIDRLAPLTSTVGTVRDTLSVNLGTGSHQVNVNSLATGNFIAPITATRGSGTNVLTINGTTSNDIVALNASQTAITRTGTGINELLTYGSSFDQVNVNPGTGNDALVVDIAGGNLNYANGVTFNGGVGTDQVTFNGSAQADTFQVDATSATSGIVRTKVGNGPLSAPITLTATEQVGINGQNPTVTPGDQLVVLDSVPGVPTLPNGSLTTPLPVAYASIEQVLIGAIPSAIADQFTLQEDAVGTFNLFANDSGLSDLPLTVSIVQPNLGSVVYNNGGTPNDISDDRFVFTPRANASGSTTFQYTVTDVNGERSTATVTVSIAPVADAPLVSGTNSTGNEGELIPLTLRASLVDTDGSETLGVIVRGVPNVVSFVDSRGNALGTNLGNGNWDLTGIDLSGVFCLARDNGIFSMQLEATASELNRLTATTSAAFVVTVGNVAPNATIMSAPTDATKDSTVTVQMAATDPSTIDKASGFTYRINWGDGTPLQTLISQPGVSPSANHVYANDGTYTITITATDKDGATGPSTSQIIRIGQTGIVNDPLNPGKTMLVVQGTEGNDNIRIKREQGGPNERLSVYFGDALLNTFAVPTSRILVNAKGGNDTVVIDANVSTNAWILGGVGNDTLLGGSGHNVLLGGEGNDQLRTREGRDILFGGSGVDFLFGGSDEDILNAGTSLFDLSDAALYAIQQEWLRPIPLESRVAHLRGSQSGGLNGNNKLIGSGPAQTVFDDNAQDTLDNHRTKDWALVNSDIAIRDIFNAPALYEELDNAPTNSTAAGEGEDSSLQSDFFLDVDGNGLITSMDALLIINALNKSRNTESDADTNLMVDVNRDHNLSPLDALLVIQRLNANIATKKPRA